MQKPVDILIVEDSPTQAVELEYVLEKNHYHALTAANGREALDMLRRFRPALVISDIVMPEMDGFTLCKMIKTDRGLKDIPVLLLTSLVNPEDVLKGLACGADSFITKPYDPGYLGGRIADMLANAAIRGLTGDRQGIELLFKGQRYIITSERRQILDLLLSTYETAVAKNLELKAARDQLEILNLDLEQKVSERTMALQAEIEVRKKAEEEVKRLNVELEGRVLERTAQLEEAVKDLETFSYSISHDLKSPLRTINSFAQMTLEDNRDQLDEAGRRNLYVINENAMMMGKLIDDVLAFSRAGRQDLHLTEIDMAALVGAVVDSLKDFTKGRAVRMEIGELPAAMGDPSAVRQIWFNLLANALKFTTARDHAVITVDGIDSGAEIIYRVMDNGVGFEPAYTHKLFGLFQRLHGADEYDGTGIGLAIVKRFLSKLGGRVWAESQPNAGATFYFSLPRRQG